MKLRVSTLLFAFVLVVLLGQSAAWAQAKAAAPLSSVRGKLQAVTADSLDIMSGKGLVHVKIKRPLKTYGRMPSSLSKVKSTSFVGVTSVKQADGTELAKAINIFPADLRGIGEGSNMMDMPPGSVSQSRMTNGSVAPTPAAGSRMTNGTVQKQGAGTTLVVKYQEGAQTISVPANVEVTETVSIKAQLKAGDTVNVVVEKQADGSFTTSKVYLIAPGSAAK